MKVLGAEPFLPAERRIEDLREAVQRCQGCDLYREATQAVFGLGPEAARLVLVGETPGDKEDLQGQPFVGPAGKVLFEALDDLGIARDKIYVTNAVKHFKFKLRGRRRIHETPRASEMRACLPWLEAELDAVHPELIACLGATATGAVVGPEARVLRDRGRIFETAYGRCLVTVHPSSILRVDDPRERQAAYDAFVADLRPCREFS
jgi:DNA polymerase